MSSGVYYFFGGLLMILGSLLEFILGNTFPFVVFGSFGAFWLSYAATLTPAYDGSIAYDPTHPYLSSLDPEFAATFAYFHLYMSLLCFIYLLCSLRTNICFMLIFLSLVPAFSCLAAAFWKIAEATPEAAAVALKCQHAAGGLVFAVSLLGWYLFAVQLLASVDFPINLPVGDLSRFIKGASEKKKTA
jgi:succinate-acetate transporter protein